jgi:photosystem II stability/assembly factor-like uncharacterized protein
MQFCASFFTKKAFKTMFQRQAREPFPVRNIVVVAALVGVLVYLFISKKAADTPTQAAPTSGALRPSEAWEAAKEYPNLVPDANMYALAMHMAVEQSVERGVLGAFDQPWTVQGPANIGARVNTIKVHPTNPNIIYIGYSGGGVWKTTNGGQTWNPIFDNRAFLCIGDIELDPANPNVVYVGTGDPNIGLNAAIGDGLWRSPDGGQTWEHLGLENQRIISKIVIDPTNPTRMWVATMGLPFERNNDRGVYRTTNGGQTWEQVLFVDNQTGASDLVQSPSDPNTLFAATWVRIRTNQESLVSGVASGVWKSTNGGSTWQRLGGGLPADTSMNRVGLAIDATNGNRVVAMYAGPNSQFHNIYETVDGGDNWTVTENLGLDLEFQRGFAWYFGKVRVNPFNPDDIWACGVEMWRSLDGGTNWYQTTPDWWLYEVHADMHDVAFVDANTVLIATDGGLYRSTDGGNFWEKIENIPTSQFYRVAHNPHEPTWYYGGMQDNGTSGGNADFVAEWPRLYGGDGFQAVFHPISPDIFYFETQNGNIVGTTQGFNDIQDATFGIEPTDRRFWDMPYFISPHNTDRMYTGTYRVYAGDGHLPSWYPISEDLTDGPVVGGTFNTIASMDESPLVAGRLYVGTTDGNVWRGNTNTGEWANISAGLPDRYVSSIRASLTNPDQVYVTHSGYRDNDFTPHIHVSYNGGQTWQSAAGNLPPLAIHDVLQPDATEPDVLAIATDAGVYATRDGGANWTRLGVGMPPVRVLHLGVNPDQRTLVAGTFARSIMTYPLDSLVQPVSVQQPNPASRYAWRVTPTLLRSGQSAQFEVAGLAFGDRAEVVVLAPNGSVVWQEHQQGIEVGARALPLGRYAAGTYVVTLRVNGRLVGSKKLQVM